LAIQVDLGAKVLLSKRLVLWIPDVKPYALLIETTNMIPFETSRTFAETGNRSPKVYWLEEPKS